MRFFFSTSILLIVGHSWAQNALPVISNLATSYDTDSKRITITYDVSDAEGEALAITLLASNGGREGFGVSTQTATGDVGPAIPPGANKTIVWDATELAAQGGPYRIKLIADDGFQIDIQGIVDQVDSARLLANLQFIEGVRHRTAGRAKLSAVKDSIESRFVAAGLETRRQDFPFGNATGQNIIGRKVGTTQGDTAYLITGHLDTVDDSPGADDNGSSVAGIMEVARVLAPYRFAKTVRFVQFDLEEAGLVGSSYYVANSVPDPKAIKGVFNMEMIGYFSNEPNSQTLPQGFGQLYPAVSAQLEADQFRGNYITNIGDQNSTAMIAAYDGAAVRYVPGLKSISIAAPASWATLTPDLGRSDHAPFWRKGIPALMLTDGANFRNPNYHTPRDVISTLDFTFMSNVVKAVVGAVAEQAGLQHSTVAEAEVDLTVSVDNPLTRTLVVSPNPARGVLTLDFGVLALTEVAVQMFNSAGQVVWAETLQLSGGRSARLDIGDLVPGVYSLVLVANGQQASREVVVE